MAMKETAETWIRIDLFCDGRPPHLQAALEELHSSLVSNDPGPRNVPAAEIWRARGAADAAL